MKKAKRILLSFVAGISMLMLTLVQMPMADVSAEETTAWPGLWYYEGDSLTVNQRTKVYYTDKLGTAKIFQKDPVTGAIEGAVKKYIMTMGDLSTASEPQELTPNAEGKIEVTANLVNGAKAPYFCYGSEAVGSGDDKITNYYICSAETASAFFPVKINTPSSGKITVEQGGSFDIVLVKNNGFEEDLSNESELAWGPSFSGSSIFTNNDGKITVDENAPVGTYVCSYMRYYGGRDGYFFSYATACEVEVTAPETSNPDPGPGGTTPGGTTPGGTNPGGNTPEGTTPTPGGNTSGSDTTKPSTTYDKIPTVSGEVNNITGKEEVTDGKFMSVGLKNTNAELEKKLGITAEEKANGVNVWMELNDISNSVPQADKDKIVSAAGGKTVGMYLDLNLYKQVTGGQKTKISNTDGDVTISVVVPENLRKAGRTFEIVYLHEGKTKVVKPISYNEKTGELQFNSGEFSTYALTYTDAATATPTATTAPKTGEPTNLWMLLVLAVGVCGLCIVTRREER